MKQNQSFFKETGTKRDRLAFLRGLVTVTALAAALVFSFAACDKDSGDEGGNKDFAGTLIIATSPYGNAVTTATTNTLLYAEYTMVAGDPPSGSITYQWKKDDTDISGATSANYRPTEAGSYTVTISAAGYNSKTSAAVAVSESDKS
jgi:hypothetical protein